MTTTLLFVRHGATAANVSRPYTLQGLRPDSELIDAGLRQAEAVAVALASVPLSRVYTSPLRRARATADAIASRHGLTPEVVEQLVEIDIGLWSGMTWEEVERRWPDEHRAFHDDGEHHGYLGGENFAQVRDRLLPVVGRLAAANDGKTAAVVGHGVTNRVLLTHWLGLPLKFSRRLPHDNCGVSVVDFHGGEAKVRTINAADHLKAVPVPA